MKRQVMAHRDDLQYTLKQQALLSKEARHLHRLHCVLLVVQGNGCADVARWFGETPRTVQRWVKAYTQAGTEALYDAARSGRPPRLTQDQRDKLISCVRGPPRKTGYYRDDWDSGLVRIYLAERLNVRFSVRQCQRLLKSIQQSISAARPQNPIGDAPDYDSTSVVASQAPGISQAIP